MTNHYLNPNLFKALKGGAPYFGGGDTSMGPRGGQIKKISPTTGKPIYYKKWEAKQGFNAHPVTHEDKGGYEVYHKGAVIGKTERGLPIQADSKKAKNENYEWRDHVNAHQAHFSLAQYIKNMILERLLDGKDTSKLHGRYDAHMGFSKHHYKEALLDLVHGEDQPESKEDLSVKETSVPNER